MTYKAGLVHTWDGFCPLPPRVPSGPADCTGTSESQGARHPEKTRYGRAAPAACGNAASPGSHIPLGKQAGRLDGSSTTSHHTAEKRKRVKPADQPPVPLRLVPAGASPAPRASRSWPTGSQGRRGLWMVMASLLARDAGAHHTPSPHTATQASQACCLGNQQPCQRMFSNEGPRSPGPGHQQGSSCDSTWVSSPPAKAAGNVLLVPRVWLTSPPL